MRTKFGIHAAVLAIVALGVLMLGSTAAMAHGKNQHPLRLVGTVIQTDDIDVGDPGPSLGDELVYSETLSRRGREVGESGVVCTIVQITLQGLVEVQGEDDRGPWTVAITGGTGAYRGASGEARVRQRNDTTTIYKLRFDSAKKNKHRH